MEVNQMMINKAYKFRIYQNQAETILINKTMIGCVVLAYYLNLYLWTGLNIDTNSV